MKDRVSIVLELSAIAILFIALCGGCQSEKGSFAPDSTTQVAVDVQELKTEVAELRRQVDVLRRALVQKRVFDRLDLIELKNVDLQAQVSSLIAQRSKAYGSMQRALEDLPELE